MAKARIVTLLLLAAVCASLLLSAQAYRQDNYDDGGPYDDDYEVDDVYEMAQRRELSFGDWLKKALGIFDKVCKKVPDVQQKYFTAYFKDNQRRTARFITEASKVIPAKDQLKAAADVNLDFDEFLSAMDFDDYDMADMSSAELRRQLGIFGDIWNGVKKALGLAKKVCKQAKPVRHQVFTGFVNNRPTRAEAAVKTAHTLQLVPRKPEGPKPAKA